MNYSSERLSNSLGIIQSIGQSWGFHLALSDSRPHGLSLSEAVSPGSRLLCLTAALMLQEALADNTQDCSQTVFPWLCLGKPNCCNCVIKLSLYPRKWARVPRSLFLWLSQIIKWAAASKYVCGRLIWWLRVLAYSWLPTHSSGLLDSSNGALKVNLSWQFK